MTSNSTDNQLRPIKPEEKYSTTIANLTPEQREYYLSQSENIAFGNKTALQEFGSDVNSIISQGSGKLLSQVSDNIDDDIIGYVNETLSALDTINIDDLNPNWTFKNWLRTVPVLKRLVKTVKEVLNDYDTVQQDIDKISSKFKTLKMNATTDNSGLEEMKISNALSINRIRELVISLKLRKEELSAEFDRLKKEDGVDSWQIKEMDDYLQAVDRRINNLMVMEGNLNNAQYEILATISNNNAIIEKCDDITDELIPNWTNNLTRAIKVRRQTQALNAINIVGQAVNASIIETSNRVRENSVRTAEETEKAIIQLDTMKVCYDNTINMLKDVKKVHLNARKERQEFEKSLEDIKARVSQEMLAIENKSGK